MTQNKRSKRANFVSSVQDKNIPWELCPMEFKFPGTDYMASRPVLRTQDLDAVLHVDVVDGFLSVTTFDELHQKQRSFVFRLPPTESGKGVYLTVTASSGKVDNVGLDMNLDANADIPFWDESPNME